MFLVLRSIRTDANEPSGKLLDLAPPPRPAPYRRTERGLPRYLFAAPVQRCTRRRVFQFHASETDSPSQSFSANVLSLRGPSLEKSSGSTVIQVENVICQKSRLLLSKMS